jgi:hypothetical protein
LTSAPQKATPTIVPQPRSEQPIVSAQPKPVRPTIVPNLVDQAPPKALPTSTPNTIKPRAPLVASQPPRATVVEAPARVVEAAPRTPIQRQAIVHSPPIQRETLPVKPASPPNRMAADPAPKPAKRSLVSKSQWEGNGAMEQPADVPKKAVGPSVTAPKIAAREPVAVKPTIQPEVSKLRIKQPEVATVERSPKPIEPTPVTKPAPAVAARKPTPVAPIVEARPTHVAQPSHIAKPAAAAPTEAKPAPAVVARPPVRKLDQFADAAPPPPATLKPETKTELPPPTRPTAKSNSNGLGSFVKAGPVTAPPDKAPPESSVASLGGAFTTGEPVEMRPVSRAPKLEVAAIDRGQPANDLPPVLSAEEFSRQNRSERAPAPAVKSPPTVKSPPATERNTTGLRGFVTTSKAADELPPIVSAADHARQSGR